MGKKFKAIPDRWEAYSKFGSVVRGTCFFPFKVPLREALTQRLSEDERFTPASLMKQLNQNKKPLGLLIDLTNTQRYYCPMEFKNQNVRYVKIFCPGHGAVPRLKMVKRFYKAVDGFLNSDSEKEELIGVHCTHGINRTGYLICRYMIEKMDFPAAEALKAFEEARGYPIERREYIKDLHNLQPLSGLDDCVEDDDDDDDGNSSGNQAHRCDSCTGPNDIDNTVFIDNTQLCRDMRDNAWFSDPSEIPQYREVHQRNDGYNKTTDQRFLRNYSDVECKPASSHGTRHQAYKTTNYQAIVRHKNRSRQSRPDKISESYSYHNRTRQYGNMDMYSQTYNTSSRYYPEEERTEAADKDESGHFIPPKFPHMSARNFRQFHPYHSSSDRDVIQPSRGCPENHTWSDARHYLNSYSRLNRRARHDFRRYQR